MYGEKMNVTFELPWPPTSNTYWRRNGGRYFISKRGIEYREHVYKSCRIYKGLFDSSDKITVDIKAFPPDKRKRDLDNLFKSLLDSFQYCGIYKDDCQIDKLSIERMYDNIGKIIVKIETI